MFDTSIELLSMCNVLVIISLYLLLFFTIVNAIVSIAVVVQAYIDNLVLVVVVVVDKRYYRYNRDYENSGTCRPVDMLVDFIT
jgi:hypothetical protein